MLAAFVRAEYPDLFYSAVASSAPVKGVLDIKEFENVVSGAYVYGLEALELSITIRGQIETIFDAPLRMRPESLRVVPAVATERCG